MDLEQFVLEAEAAGAVVFNALPGDLGGSGYLSACLARAGVPYTGPRWVAAAVCSDKVRASQPFGASSIGRSHSASAFGLARTRLCSEDRR